MTANKTTTLDIPRIRSLAAAILCAAMCGCGFTLLMPVMSLELEAMTGSGTIVGIVGSSAALSTLLMTPLVPRIMAKLAGRPLLVFSLWIAAITLPFFPLLPNPWIWFLLRFAMGAALSIVFVASETWINQIAPREKRATILGLYASALAGGFGLGGILFAVIGSAGWMPWLVGIAILAGGSIPVLLLRGPDIEPPKAEEATIFAMLSAARFAPAAIGAGLLFGSTETIFYTQFPVYAERIGLSEVDIGSIVVAGAVGGILLQTLIGHVADKFGRLRMAFIVTLVCILCPALVFLAGTQTFAIFAVMFVYVGFATGLYTLGLAIIGDRFSGGAMAAANAAFIMAYGIGSLIGPPAAGFGMDTINPFGLLLVTGGFAAVYLGFLLIRHFTRKNA